MVAVDRRHDRLMEKLNRGLYRSPRIQNLNISDSNSWYQSTRGVPRACNMMSRRIKKRFHRNYHSGDSDFWNQRQKEVLQGLDDMNICDQKDTHGFRLFSRRNSRRLKQSRCYVCYGRGHAYWNCPNIHRRSEITKGKQVIGGIQENIGNDQNDVFVPTSTWQVIGSDGKGWNEIWYVSEEHPRHMTPNLEVFKNFKRDSICSSTTIQSGWNVQGFGEIMVQTESHKFVIPGALFVSNVGLNILSLSQLLQQGFEVVIKDSKCILRSMFDTTSSEDNNNPDSDKERKSDSEMSEKEDVERLDVDKERAIRAIMRYYDSLYFKDTIIGEGNESDQAPSQNDFESLIGFLHMINEQEIVPECKGLVKEHFEKLVKWFYKVFMNSEERPIPVKVSKTEICLLDLYLKVKEMGGHARVTINNKWIQVAEAMELPKELADGLKECYATHLSLLAAYYEVAKDYPDVDVVLHAADCAGTSGIKAAGSPKEETAVDCKETKKEYLEYNEDEGLTGKIEYDDGETLIISFEGNKEESETDKDADQGSNDKDDFIIID